MPRAFFVSICLLLAANLTACATGSGSESWNDHAEVRFMYSSLSPQTVRIPPNGTVTWIDQANEASGMIFFSSSAAAGFTCRDLEPFRKTPEGYLSLPTSGAGSNQISLPCSLAPGTYDYEVWIRGEGFGESVESAPQQKLSGRIVVE